MSLVEYVVGYAFNRTLNGVLLIKKQRPSWQAGRLNGVGGKIEPGEQPIDAMVREFREETNLATGKSDWHRFATLDGPEVYLDRPGELFRLHLFSAALDGLGNAWAPEGAEQPDIVYVPDLSMLVLDGKVLPNVGWMVMMALAFRGHERACAFEVREVHVEATGLAERRRRRDWPFPWAATIERITVQGDDIDRRPAAHLAFDGRRLTRVRR